MTLPIVSSSPLPPRYAAWMDEVLGGTIPNETSATCESCAMCSTTSAQPSEEQAGPEGRFFVPDVKCCSYHPILFNFLTGDLLADDSPEAAVGRETVERRIAAGIAVTPLGLDRDPVYDVLYNHILPAFGQTRSMLCPHFLTEAGLCGVWRHRESTCSTFFCKHVRGSVGKTFWERLRQLLRTTEESLARWCVLELDLGSPAMAALFPMSRPEEGKTVLTARDFDQLPDPGRHRRIWGRWAGRERELYLAAADLVRPLSWSQIAALGGSHLAVQVQLVREAYEALTSTELPERLVARPVKLSPVGAASYQAVTYSPLDPIQLPVRLAQLLHYFDGRATSEALDAIAQDHRLQLTPDLIRKLVDYGILAPA